MLLTHAVILAEVRSYVAALADRANTFEASAEYEHVLLQLDLIHGDDAPGISPVSSTDPEDLFSTAETAIEDLVRHGSDALKIELVLDMLHTARAKDAP